VRLAETDNIFPLTLSNFEHYAFRDDSPAHPMVIALRTPFEGTLDETAFRVALRETLDANPLLRATVDNSGWQTQWRLSEDFEPPLTCHTYETQYPPVSCPLKWINLERETGAVFELRLCATRGVLISHIHHACADGIGAMRFLGDLFSRYGQLTATCDEDRPRVRTPNPAVLAKRGATRMPGHRRERSAPILHTLLETCRLLFRKNYRFKKDSPVLETKKNEENIIHTQVLPRTIVKQLKKLAAARAVTLNDLLMMVSFQQLADWSAAAPGARPNDLLRVLMPVSMRSPDHDEISAANVVSYVFHSYRRHQIHEAQSLLATIHHKSHQMITRNEGAAMLHGFALTRWLPGLYWLSQKLQPDFATAVVTNVGEVRRLFDNRFPMKRGRAIAGNIMIQSVDGVAPVRQNTNITVAFGTYGGELIMHVNRNTSLFSETEADEMAAMLADRLVALAQTVDPRVPDDGSTTHAPAHVPESGEPSEESSARDSVTQVHM
jgi:NRPS condensation-like uncharacterized protein